VRIKQVADPANPIGQPWNVGPSAGRPALSRRLQHQDHFGCRHARNDAIDCCVAHRPISLDDKGRRLRNSTLLPRIIDVPLLNDTALRIAQDREGKIQVTLQRLRYFRGIYGDRDNSGPGRADLLVVIAVVHQLAEAEWSPRATVEEQDDRARRDQF